MTTQKSRLNMLTALFTALLAAGAAVASPLAKRDFGPVTIFDPPAEYNIPRTLYARGLRLNDVSHVRGWAVG